MSPVRFVITDIHTFGYTIKYFQSRERAACHNSPQFCSDVCDLHRTRRTTHEISALLRLRTARSNVISDWTKKRPLLLRHTSKLAFNVGLMMLYCHLLFLECGWTADDLKDRLIVD